MASHPRVPRATPAKPPEASSARAGTPEGAGQPALQVIPTGTERDLFSIRGPRARTDADVQVPGRDERAHRDSRGMHQWSSAAAWQRKRGNRSQRGQTPFARLSVGRAGFSSIPQPVGHVKTARPDGLSRPARRPARPSPACDRRRKTRPGASDKRQDRRGVSQSRKAFVALEQQFPSGQGLAPGPRHGRDSARRGFRGRARGDT